MSVIRFRRLEEETAEFDNLRWEIATNVNDLNAKLDGEMAEVIMPALAWPIRLWRIFFPRRAQE